MPIAGMTPYVTCSMQTTDMDRSIKWYGENLGFKLLYRVDDIGWCEMGTHMQGVNVGLSVVEKPDVKGGATLTWGVNDIASARKTLESRGVKFDGETMTLPGMVMLATFFDPDGNKMMLFQDLSQH